MEKQHVLSIDLKEDKSAKLKITVAKSGSQLNTEATVSSRSGSYFSKNCLTTEVGRFNQESLQVHIDWIEENKDTLIQEATILIDEITMS